MGGFFGFWVFFRQPLQPKQTILIQMNEKTGVLPDHLIWSKCSLMHTYMPLSPSQSAFVLLIVLCVRACLRAFV